MSKRKLPVKAYKNLEFLTGSNARPIRILAEYSEPYYRFKENDIHSTIVFFGSARIKPKETAKKNIFTAAEAYEKKPTPANEHKLSEARLQLRLSKYYEDAVELAGLITEWAKIPNSDKQKLYICSGGGPGIMEAANKGAHQVGGKSIGINISLPHEQEPNPYISEEFMFDFHYFFMRKYWLVYLAQALVVFPGGFGTLDEMMEVLTLIQTKKIDRPLPIIIFGQDYWKEIIDLEAMARWGTIAEKDLELFHFVNSAKEGFKLLTQLLPEL